MSEDYRGKDMLHRCHKIQVGDGDFVDIVTNTGRISMQYFMTHDNLCIHPGCLYDDVEDPADESIKLIMYKDYCNESIISKIPKSGIVRCKEFRIILPSKRPTIEEAKYRAEHQYD